MSRDLEYLEKNFFFFNYYFLFLLFLLFQRLDFLTAASLLVFWCIRSQLLQNHHKFSYEWNKEWFYNKTTLGLVFFCFFFTDPLHRCCHLCSGVSTIKSRAEPNGKVAACLCVWGKKKPLFAAFADWTRRQFVELFRLVTVKRQDLSHRDEI